MSPESKHLRRIAIHLGRRHLALLALPFLLAGLLLLLAAVAGSRTQAQTDTVTAPKRLEAPVLDGECTDAAYAQAGAISWPATPGGPETTVWFVHSSVDFYLCFAGIDGGNRAVARIDGNHNRSGQIEAGDYEFSVDSTGAIGTRQGSAGGAWTALTMPEADRAAAVTPGAGTSWNAELRISLEWLGGYARTDGLSVFVELANGTPVNSWPAGANAGSPASWGDLVLAPLVPDGVTAGSAFLDGRDGYLVVPYAPDLNPSEITIEAWVNVVDGDCGTMVGNGQDVSYWMAVCQMLQFGHDGADSVRAGQQPLGEGWHHVAVTMGGERGMRTFYVDGEVDLRPGWEPAQNEEPGEVVVAELGVSDRMLRIGSDRAATDEMDRLHGYVSELRIWNRVRSVHEIRADAFRRLGGSEPGLVALWPFTGSLADLAGSHDAGLIGNASLAKIAPDVTAFPERPTPEPYTYPDPPPLPAWVPQIPAAPGEIVLDGICDTQEYGPESRMILEPAHRASMLLVAGNDALYLCTNGLWGSETLGGAVTLWIDRAGLGGAAPQAEHLRLILTPDGLVAAATGDGTGYGGPAAIEVMAQTIGADIFDLQEDIYPVASPWWLGEVRIPYAGLAPFEPGMPLYLALRSEGKLAAGIGPQGLGEDALVSQWPADFDPQRPDTWGIATTSTTLSRIYLPLITRSGPESEAAAPAGQKPDADGLILVTPAQAAALSGSTPRAVADWPQPPPGTGEYYANCPTDLLSTMDYPFFWSKKWPSVDPTHRPFAQAEGTVSSIVISNEDSVAIHPRSHDLDMKMTVPYDYRYLVLNGGDSLVLETEYGYLDPRVIPVPGDHVTVKGRWIFDCGHAPKTEIHAIPMFETDREEAMPDGLGAVGHITYARRVRVWMTPHTGALDFNLSALGPFTFNVQLPSLSHGFKKQVFTRVVSGDPNYVTLVSLAGGATFSITPPGPSGDYYFELLVGFLEPSHELATMRHTVTLQGIDVLNSLDPNAESGEWYLWVAVNDQWQRIWENQPVLGGYGVIVPVNVSYQTFGEELRVRVMGYENDDPFYAGDTLGNSDVSDLGWMLPGQHTLETAAFRAYFDVQGGAPDLLTALPMNDSAFWISRLFHEPDDPVHTDLGTLSVPDVGAPALVTETTSYLLRWPFEKHDVSLWSPDDDLFKFALDDFANVTFGSLPSGAQVQVDETFPWNYSGEMPPELEALLGYRSAWLRVFDNDANPPELPYTLKIYRTARILPPDPGEDQDEDREGRLVDLFTPARGTQVGGFYSEVRTLQMYWAWQHVKGDVDYYNVWIPPVTERPPGQPPCEFDQEGHLDLEAFDMQLQVPAVGATAVDALRLTDLNNQFPSGHVRVEIRNAAGTRGVYRLWARWTDGFFFDPQMCAFLRQAKALVEEIAGTSAGVETAYFPQLDLPDPSPEILRTDLYAQGGYQVVQMSQNGLLDVLISSELAQPLSARLYDGQGILLAEGIAAGEAGAMQAVGEAGAMRAVVDGQVPRSRLTADGLVAGENYLLQIVPAFDVGEDGVERTAVGITLLTTNPTPTATPTLTATATARVTETATPTATATATPKATATATPTATATARVTETATASPTVTATVTPKVTATATPTATATRG